MLLVTAVVLLAGCAFASPYDKETSSTGKMIGIVSVSNIYSSYCRRWAFGAKSPEARIHNVCRRQCVDDCFCTVPLARLAGTVHRIMQEQNDKPPSQTKAAAITAALLKDDASAAASSIAEAAGSGDVSAVASALAFALANGTFIFFHATLSNSGVSHMSD
jgi:hypothetical protein